MTNPTTSIAQALDENKDDPTYKYTYKEADRWVTRKRKLTQEDALKVLNNELHFSWVALFDQYGTEVEDE